MVGLHAEPLSVERAVDVVRSDGDGAVALFVGVVRDHNAGRRVLFLEYHAYMEMAERELARVEREVRARHPAIGAIDVRHRTGRVEIGEASVVVAVAAPHRAAALGACAEIVERLKRTVPIWKKEYFEGGEAWIEGPAGPKA